MTHPEKLTKSLAVACSLPVLTEALAISNDVVACRDDKREQLRDMNTVQLPADGADMAGKMPPPSDDDDPLGTFLIALEERESVPPTLPQDDARRSGDTILLKQEADGPQRAGLTAAPPHGLAELPVANSELRLVMSDTLAGLEDGAPQPDYSVGNQWFVSAEQAGLAATDSASTDNAADAISATLAALDERRSQLLALDTHEASRPLIASEHAEALRTADKEPVADLAQSQNRAVPSERAVEVKQNGSMQSPSHDWLAVSNNNLDGMRGGFATGTGLMVSFGIERAVYINGNLATSTSFNIPDVSKLAVDQARITANQALLAAEQAKVTSEQARVTASQARLAAEQAKVTARQAGVAAIPVAANPVQVAANPIPAVASPVPAVASPVSAVANPVPAVTIPVAVAQAGLNEQARIASEQAKISSEQARLTSEQAKINSEQARLNSEQAKISGINGATVSLVQNGPGNTFQPGPLSQTAAATVIQNTLDNQSIKSLTVINTTVNSLSVLKALNVQASLKDALGNSLGIR